MVFSDRYQWPKYFLFRATQLKPSHVQRCTCLMNFYREVPLYSDPREIFLGSLYGTGSGKDDPLRIFSGRFPNLSCRCRFYSRGYYRTLFKSCEFLHQDFLDLKVKLKYIFEKWINGQKKLYVSSTL